MGPGQTYSSIQSAVDSASPGDLISVGEGTFDENVLLNKQLTLEGMGKDKTIIRGNQTTDVVTITADDCTVTGFTITGSSKVYWPTYDAGIKIRSHSNTIKDCNCTGNQFGITVFFYFDNNTIEDCICCYNSRAGIFILNSQSTVVEDCECFNNKNEDGIHLSGTENAITRGCECYDNKYGISMHGCKTPGNLIEDCSFHHNSVGIHLPYETGAIIRDCTSNRNGGGIYMDDYGHSNTIEGSSFTHNTNYGMRLEASEDNTITGCYIKHNGGVGLEMLFWKDTSDEGGDGRSGGTRAPSAPFWPYLGCDRNEITQNVFEDNDGYAIDIDWYNYKNLIHGNQFIDNNHGRTQAFDNGSQNDWNTSSKGNYWSDWTWPDLDLNGIVDDPYELDGASGAKDHYPLTFSGSTEEGVWGFLSRYRCRAVALLLAIVGFVILAVIIIRVIRKKKKGKNGNGESRDERIENI